jgi:hypothetical protein
MLMALLFHIYVFMGLMFWNVDTCGILGQYMIADVSRCGKICEHRIYVHIII